MNTPALYLVTTYAPRDRIGRAYAFDDPAEAVRVWEGLRERKRRGVVELRAPDGRVSVARVSRVRHASWETRMGHPRSEAT